MAELLNPVLVKEVRQALRGRYFRTFFVLTLAAATLAGWIQVLRLPPDAALSEAGQDFFLAFYVCLAGALLAVVPFSAFQSMSAEWEESTYDLLVLSDLRPRAIVVGKLLSAFVLALIFTFTFGPFLTFAFLLRGVDLFAMGVAILGTVLFSMVLSASAIAFSSTAPARFLRTLVLMALVGSLIFFVVTASGMAYGLMTNPAALADPDLRVVLLWVGVSGVLSVAMSLAISVSRLAHAEENRSSGMRVVGSLGVLAVLGASTHFYLRWGSSYFLVAGGLLALLAIFGGGAWLAVEQRALGRRVRLSVPRSRALALLVTPWLPGSLRGVLYIVLHAGIVIAYLAGLLAFGPDPSTSAPFVFVRPDEEVLALLGTAAGYGILYLGVPLLLIGHLVDKQQSSRLVLLSMTVFAALAGLFPSLIGFLSEHRNLAQGRHFGNPFYLARLIDSERGLSDPEAARGFGILCLAAGVVLLFLLPRIVAAIREVLAASRKNATPSA